MIITTSFCRQAIFACSILTLLTTTNTSAQTTHVLFDATKAEMAGNADWVIDADQTNLGVGSSGVYITSPGRQSNPQQIPTPSQSGITATTPETYWTGGLSAWAVDCAKKGYIVETLPWNGQITYNNTSNPQDLSNYQVYIIDEPNLVFTAIEKTAIIQFVQNGGSLFIISDHNNSDRNGNGWDSPHIWNDFFSNNSISTNPFGITFDLDDFSGTTTNISASANDSIIHGPMGSVTKAQWSGGTTMTLTPAINPSIKGVIYRAGTTPGSSGVMVAYGRYGAGKIAAIGDSSPTDDGTGNSNCTLYTGYTGDAGGNHRLLLMNITIWLATRGNTTSVTNVLTDANHISIYPNPSKNKAQLSADQDLSNVTITISNLTGAIILKTQLPHLFNNEQYSFSLNSGFYIVRTESDQITQNSKITVY